MNSPTEHHLGAAFRDLVAEQPFTPDVPAIEHLARQARRRDRIARGGIGVGVVAVAAVAAVGVASALPSGPARTAQASRTAPATRTAQVSGAHPANTRAPASPTRSADGQPQLLTLAADLAAKPRPAGDATLVERETRPPGQASVNVWDLYTDDGRYFFSQTEASLPAQVQENNNQGDGIFGLEVAAANYAANGNLDTAALKMAWAQRDPGPRLALGAGQEHVGRRAADRQLCLGGLRGRAGRGFRQPPGAGRRAAPGVRAARHHRHPWHR